MTSDNLEKVEVNNLMEALILRNIRNDCRDIMTRDRRKIGLLQQIEWFLVRYSWRKDIGKLHAYLFYWKKIPVGYGLIRLDNRGTWITGGLKKVYRDMGFGTEIAKKMVSEWGARTSLKLELLDKNEIGQKIYKELGFRKEGKRDDGHVVILAREKRKLATI